MMCISERHRITQTKPSNELVSFTALKQNCAACQQNTGWQNENGGQSPYCKELEIWLRDRMQSLSRHSELAKAFAYALNQWSALTYYTENGWIEVDNNIAENALRLVSLGRKNFLFFGSDHGGERGALLYSLLGTCRLNGVDPEHYLRHVLNVIADWPVNRVSELLPWRVALPIE